MRPNDDHPIRVARHDKRVRVKRGGRALADSRNALCLFEASYPGVRYLPRADVDMVLLRKSEHTTRCPYKGLATYFSIVTPEGVAENAVWCYEQPFPVAAEIAGYLAFDTRHISIDEDAIS